MRAVLPAGCCVATHAAARVRRRNPVPSSRRLLLPSRYTPAANSRVRSHPRHPVAGHIHAARQGGCVPPSDGRRCDVAACLAVAPPLSRRLQPRRYAHVFRGCTRRRQTPAPAAAASHCPCSRVVHAACAYAAAWLPPPVRSAAGAPTDRFYAHTRAHFRCCCGRVLPVSAAGAGARPAARPGVLDCLLPPLLQVLLVLPLAAAGYCTLPLPPPQRGTTRARVVVTHARV